MKGAIVEDHFQTFPYPDIFASELAKSLSQNTLDTSLVMEGGGPVSESGLVSAENLDEGDRSAEVSPERNLEEEEGSQQNPGQSPHQEVEESPARGEEESAEHGLEEMSQNQ